MRHENVREEDYDTQENVSEFLVPGTTSASNLHQPKRDHEAKDPASVSQPQLVTSRGQLIEQMTNIYSRKKDAGTNQHVIL